MEVHTEIYAPRFLHGKIQNGAKPVEQVQVPDQLICHMHLALDQGGYLSPPGFPDCSMLLLCLVDAAHAAPPSAAPAVLPLCAIMLLCAAILRSTPPPLQHPPMGSVFFQPHGGPIFLPCNAQLDYYQ